MSHIIDQQSISVFMNVYPIVLMLFCVPYFVLKLNKVTFLFCALLAKYGIPSLSLPVHIQKNYTRNHCVSKAVDGHLTFLGGALSSSLIYGRPM